MLWEEINVLLVVWEYVSEVCFNQNPQPQSVTQKIIHSVFLDSAFTRLEHSVRCSECNRPLRVKKHHFYPEIKAEGKGRKVHLDKNWIQVAERLTGAKTQFERQKVKVEMFTWDSSGCMSKENVSIMCYQRHTNRLIEKAKRRISKVNITFAHFRTQFVMQSQTLNLLHKPNKTIKYIWRCIRCNSAVISVSKLRENHNGGSVWVGRGQTALGRNHLASLCWLNLTAFMDSNKYESSGWA